MHLPTLQYWVCAQHLSETNANKARAEQPTVVLFSGCKRFVDSPCNGFQTNPGNKKNHLGEVKRPQQNGAIGPNLPEEQLRQLRVRLAHGLVGSGSGQVHSGGKLILAHVLLCLFVEIGLLAVDKVGDNAAKASGAVVELEQGLVLAVMRLPASCVAFLCNMLHVGMGDGTSCGL